MIAGGAHRQPRRPRFEVQRREPRQSVKPAIFQHDAGRTGEFCGGYAASRPPLASHFKDVGKIIVEQQREIEVRGMVAVVLQADPLIGGATPEEDRAHDVQRILAQHEPAIAINVGIGEIDSERRIVVAQVGTEQQRLDVVQHHFELCQIAGIGVKQPVGASRRSTNVAVAIKNDEGVVVLQRAPRARRRPRHRNIERRLCRLLDLTVDDELAYRF